MALDFTRRIGGVAGRIGGRYRRFMCFGVSLSLLSERGSKWLVRLGTHRRVPLLTVVPVQ